MSHNSTAQPEQVSREQILFDRQVRLWGPHGQRKLRHTNILSLGSSVSITEALKGVILPSIESFTIVDDAIVTQYNVSNNFFLTKMDLGRSIADCLVASLGELNTSCRGIAVKETISDHLTRLLFNTLYQLSNNGPSSDNDLNMEQLTPQQYQSNLQSFIETNYPQCTTLFNSTLIPTPPAPKPIPGLPAHLQPKPIQTDPTVQSTTLFDYSLLIVDPTRIPTTLHTILSTFTTTFNIPLLTIGSYSTFSMVKTTYPQRITLETHFKANPGAINLYLNRYQLQRFTGLTSLAMDPQFDYLDMAVPSDKSSMTYIDLKAKRSKVPYNLILIRHFMEWKNAKSLKEMLGPLDSNGTKEFEKYIRGKKWYDEDSYTEAIKNARLITTTPEYRYVLSDFGKVYNSSLITKKDKSVIVQTQEKEIEFKIDQQDDDGGDNINDLFFNLSDLLSQVSLYQRVVGLNNVNTNDITHHNDQHVMYGDYNHPYWLLITTMRLFILNFPIAKATQGNTADELQTLLSSQYRLDFNHLVNHFTTLSDNLNNDSNIHKAFGCLPINPVLPDMPSSNELYNQVKQLYKEQFELDCGLFLIYLNYVVKEYAKQREKLFPNTNNQSWYYNITNYLSTLKSSLQVDDPVHYFLLNCREIRVNEGITAFNFSPIDYQTLFTHHSNNNNTSSSSNNDNNQSTQMSQDDSTKDQIAGAQGTEDQALVPTQPNTLWDLLTIQYLRDIPLFYSFTNTYTSSILAHHLNTPVAQRRMKDITSSIQSLFYEGAKNHLVDFYCSVLSLYEFQLTSRRFPLTSTSLSNKKLLITPGLYSMSNDFATALHLQSMSIATSQQPLLQQPSDTNMNDGSNNSGDLTVHLNLSTHRSTGSNNRQEDSHQTDEQILQLLHTSIFNKFTHNVTFYDQNGEEITALPPRIGTTSHLFQHQFTELPTTASITGSMAADLILKFSLGQYTVPETTMLFDGLHTRGGPFYL